jgi:hypothetical protein
LAAAAANGLNATERGLTSGILSSAVTVNDGTATINYTATRVASNNCAAATGYSGSIPAMNTGIINADATDWRICVKVFDAAGNTSYGATTTFVVDTGAPSILSGFQWTGDTTGLNGAADGYLNITENAAGTTLLSAITPSETSTILYKMVQSWVVCSGESYSSSAVPTRADMTVDNTYKVCARMTDNYGNVSYQNTTNLTRDTSPPTGAFVSGLPAAQSNFNSSLNIAVSGSDTSKYDYQVVSGTAASCSSIGNTRDYTTNITDNIAGLAQGNITVCMKARDVANNLQTTTTSYTWVKDTIVPADVSYSSPTGTINSATPTVQWSAPAGDVSKIHMFVSTTSSTCTNGIVQSYESSNSTQLAGNSTSKTLASIVEGTYYVCIFTLDLAGNQSSGAYGSFVYDIPQVAAPVISPGTGTYTTTQVVSMSSSTSGATIYYTTNGTQPTCSGTAYSVPFRIFATTTFKAIACAAGYIDSEVTTVTPTLNIRGVTLTTVPNSQTTITVSNVAAGTNVPVEVFVQANGSEKIHNYHVANPFFGICNWNGSSCFSWQFLTGNANLTCNGTTSTPNYNNCVQTGSPTLSNGASRVFRYGSQLDTSASFYGYLALYRNSPGSNSTIKVYIGSASGSATVSVDSWNDYNDTNTNQTLSID